MSHLQTTSTLSDVTTHHTQPMMTTSPTSMPTQSTGGGGGGGEGGGSGGVYIAVGVSVGVLLVLLATAGIVVSVYVCAKKDHRVTLTNNVAYGVSDKVIKLNPNAAYGTNLELSGSTVSGVDRAIKPSGNSAHIETSSPGENEGIVDEPLTYDYVLTNDITIVTFPNEVYGAGSDATVRLSSNEAY